MNRMIDIIGASVVLGERQVLTETDFHLEEGETVALLGASGSGKSTLARAAVGLLPVSAGRVFLAGIDLARAPAARLREVRRKVGMVFQGNALFDSMTVAENIGFSLKEVMGLDQAAVRDQVNHLLTALHLGPIGRKLPSELSGGMKKRVGIARAVAHDPELVVYDDPTAGLDPVTSQVITDLITELAAPKNRSAMIVSNYLPLINQVAQRVVIIRDGKAHDLGSPSDLLSDREADLRELLSSSNGVMPEGAG